MRACGVGGWFVDLWILAGAAGLCRGGRRTAQRQRAVAGPDMFKHLL